jgi:hypothetical protein
MPRTAISGLVCTTFLVLLGFQAAPQEPGGKGAGFIMGVASDEKIEASGGSATHSHNADVPPAGRWRVGGELAGADYGHGLPLTLIYIMKL